MKIAKAVSTVNHHNLVQGRAADFLNVAVAVSACVDISAGIA